MFRRITPDFLTAIGMQFCLWRGLFSRRIFKKPLIGCRS